MTIKIRALTPADVDAVVAFSLRAWAPVLASFSQVLGPKIYQKIYPDWLSSQAPEVAKVCRSQTTWVAVDPEHQRHGIAAALIDDAVEQLRTAGVSVVAVGTGGDPGHEPARGAYAQAGFTPLPPVRYYKAI